ncbi:probable E3 ubiquitin-protein ligase BAH1-like 1 isoform X2 [Amborella trichopoda]|nr:probable E3 ubiquitin-protein ligase BAH1-like 1 isoform X2 [Amborella trichopoda]|eukprot:XP_020521741.1 probable E3 ubiquitin-protein ligase BAH1-like 1 isoform X2 [Amborella trichopoda]
MQASQDERLEETANGGSSQLCSSDSCPVCDKQFFSELTKEASEIAGCLRSRVRRLLQLHVTNGLRGYVCRLRHCFVDDQEALHQGRILIDYITMNAMAIRKILKKYDKVHCSVNGRNFKIKMQAERLELLQSPWLIELGAFYINSRGLDDGDSNHFCRQFSCDFSGTEPVIKLIISDSVKLEYNLTCAICLDTLFNPYALACGHLFCKGCACAAASVLLFQGPKAALHESKCPVCRASGVYEDSVHMSELDLLIKTRCKEYWKERLHLERAEMVKHSKVFWDSQTKTLLGY